MAKTPTKKPGTEVVNWEAEMAAQAAVAKGEQRSTGGGGNFLSTKAGVLAYNKNEMPGNQIACVILADTLVNSYYEGAYDPDTPASPVCFAIGRDESQLEPHAAVDGDPYFERQNDVCAGCPQGEWGSAPIGRGKACKNQQRLALIPAGEYTKKGGRNGTIDLTLFDDPEHFAKAEIAYLNLPVMSVKNYTKFVLDLANELGRPPHGVIANIYLEPDPKSQYRVCFEVIQALDNDLLGAVMPRHKTERDLVGFPYQPPQAREEDAAPAKAANKLKKPAAGASKGRK